MPPRTLFNLILKVIGLFFIRNIFEAISHTVSALVYVPAYDTPKQAIINVAVTFPPLILYILLAWLFIFKSETLINLLRLDKNITVSPVNINTDRSRILTGAVIIAGVWVLINEIPEFIRHALYYYQERKLYVRMTRPDISYIIMSAVKILLGLLLIVFNKPVVAVIDWGSKRRFTTKASTADGNYKADKREAASSK